MVGGINQLQNYYNYTYEDFIQQVSLYEKINSSDMGLSCGLISQYMREHNKKRDNNTLDDDYMTDISKYRSLIGCIRYPAQLVKPVVLYAISVLATKQTKQNYEDGHWCS